MGIPLTNVKLSILSPTNKLTPGVEPGMEDRELQLRVCVLLGLGIVSKTFLVNVYLQ